MDIIDLRISLQFESIFEIPAQSVDKYLRQVPRKIAILYGLMIANYTKEDDFSKQLDALTICNEINWWIRRKVASRQLPNDKIILFEPMTGLDLLKYIFSIPKEEFTEDWTASTPLNFIMAILMINSELRAKNARFQDKDVTLFPKRIRSKFYELDDRIHVTPSIYRMFCLWFFLDTNNNDYWLKLKKELIESLNMPSLEEYLGTMLRVIERLNIQPKSKFSILPIKEHDNLYDLLKSLSFNSDYKIELKDNIDYTYFKSHPLVQLDSDKFAVISNAFLSCQLYTSLKFRMSKLHKSFLTRFNTDFVQNYLFYTILKYAFDGIHDNVVCLTENECENQIIEYYRIHTKRISDDAIKGLPDAYIRSDNKILLIECKGKTISNKALIDEERCIEDINNDIVNDNHGTGQLLHNCNRIIEGELFCDNKRPSDCIIYPLLVVDDPKLSVDGLNSYVIQKTESNKLVKDNPTKIYPFTILDIDTLIIIAELIRNKSIDIFREIEEYHKYIKGEQDFYSESEKFLYSELSFASYITGKYTTYIPKIVDEWFELLHT